MADLRPISDRGFAGARTCALRPARCLALSLVLVAGGIVSGLGACGGASKNTQYAPSTPEQQRVFDHGIDFVAALEGIEGRWRDDWDRDMQERIGGADFIGLVHIETLLTETDPEQIVTHRLVAKVTRTIFGDSRDKTLELRVREGQVGFATVHDNVARIQAREFLVFVKWYQDDNGERAAHFHLSPASEPVLSETEKIVALRGGNTRKEPEGRTIVHTN